MKHHVLAVFIFFTSLFPTAIHAYSNVKENTQTDFGNFTQAIEIAGLPVSIAIQEDEPTQLPLTDLVITSASQNSVSLLFWVSDGEISAHSHTGIQHEKLSEYGFIVTGSPASLNAYFDLNSSVQYVNSKDANNDSILSVTVFTDGIEGNTLKSTLDIKSINDAPSISLTETLGKLNFRESNSSNGGNSFESPEAIVAFNSGAPSTIWTANSDSNSLQRFDEDWINITTRIDPNNFGIHYLGTYRLGSSLENVGTNSLGLHGATGLAKSPDENHLYVVSKAANALLAFSTSGQGSGLHFLEEHIDGVGGANYLGGVHKLSLPSEGQYVATLSSDEEAVTIFKRNSSTGTLNILEELKQGANGITSLSAPDSLIWSRDSRFLLIGSSLNRRIAIFRRELSSQKMKLVNTLTNVGVTAMEWTKNGRFLFVASASDSAINTYSFDKETGEPSLLSVHQNNVGGIKDMSEPLDLVISNSGRNLYVAVNGDKSVVSFQVNPSTGALTFVDSYTNNIGGLNSITMTPDGSRVLATVKSANSQLTFARFAARSLASTMTYTEQQGLLNIAASAELRDIEDDLISRLTIVLLNGSSNSSELLAADVQNISSEISVSNYDSETGTLTLSGLSSASNYQSALRMVSYINEVEFPIDSKDTRTITIVAEDSLGAISQTATLTLELNPVRDAPVVSNLDNDSTVYLKGGDGVFLDQGLPALVTDVDSTNFDVGTLLISIVENKVADEDFLYFEGSDIRVSGDSYGSAVFVDEINVGNLERPIQLGSWLYVRFNQEATPERVAKLISSAKYKNVSNSNVTASVRKAVIHLSERGSQSSSVYTTISVINPDEDVTFELVHANTIVNSLTLNASNSVSIAKFNVKENAANDGLDTIINQVKMSLSGSANKNNLGFILRVSTVDSENSNQFVKDINGILSADLLTFSEPIVVPEGLSNGIDLDLMVYIVVSNQVIDGSSIITAIDPQQDIVLAQNSSRIITSEIQSNSNSPALFDVVATELRFTAQPNGVISERPIEAQPVVSATDINGNVDSDYSRLITLTVDGSSSGSLVNSGKYAENGIARFESATYRTHSDGESFVIVATDDYSTVGNGDNLPSVSSDVLRADIVATRLIIDRQPTPAIIVANKETTLDVTPVVKAIADNGGVDTDFNQNGTLFAVNTDAIVTVSSSGDIDNSQNTVTVPFSKGFFTPEDLSIQFNSNGSISKEFNLRIESSNLAIETNNLSANVLPKVQGLPSVLTVNEDSFTALDFSNVSLIDPDNEDYTLTFLTNIGEIRPVDGAGETAGVSISGYSSGSGLVVLRGSLQNLQSYITLPGKLEYRNFRNYSQDAFLFIALSDGQSLSEEYRTLLRLSTVNSSPEILEGSALNVSMSEDGLPIPFSLALNASDREDEPLTWSISSNSSNGIASVGSFDKSATVNYVPEDNFFGTDIFTVQVQDGEGAIDTIEITVTIESINDIPIISGSPSSYARVNTDYNFIPVVFDGDGDALTFNIQNKPDWASFDPATGRLYGVPSEAHVGTTTNITISVSDGKGGESSLPSFSLSAHKSNSAPVITEGQSIDIRMSEDGSPIEFELTLNASDADVEDVLSWSLLANASRGSADVIDNGEQATIYYTPITDYYGHDSFSVRVEDSSFAEDVITINVDISSVNDSPNAVADESYTDVDTAVIIDVLANDTDPDDNELTIANAVASHGTVSISIDNLIHYTPNSGFIGTDVINYSVMDFAGAESSSTVAVTIRGQDIEAPEFIGEFPVITVEATGPLTEVQLPMPDVRDASEIQEIKVDNDGPYSLGSTFITWTAIDSVGNSSSQSQEIFIKDTTPPELPTIGTIEIFAKGLMVNLHNSISEKAFDLVNGEVELNYANGSHLISGTHDIVYFAEDESGNRSSGLLTAIVHPGLMISESVFAASGTIASIPFNLTGHAAIYPVTVKFDVNTLGEFETHLESGLEGALRFSLPNTAIDSEKFEVNVQDVLNSSVINNASSVVSVISENTSPTIDAHLSQAGKETSIIEGMGGEVALNVMIRDLNVNDSHSVSWMIEDEEVSGTDILQIDTQSIEPGTYRVNVTVKENNTEQAFSTSQTLIFSLVETKPELSNDIDSDGDGLNDNEEGFNDVDSDGIPDYLDDDPNRTRIPLQNTKRHIQVDSGLQLEIGNLAKQVNANQVTNATLNEEELAKFSGDMYVNDTHYSHISDISNFSVLGFQRIGRSADIVIPVSGNRAIPENAVYRNFGKFNGWYTFIENEDNTIMSSQLTIDDNCPLPSSTLWQGGLNEGAQCIKLSIKDGGSNDWDGASNGIIQNVSVLATTKRVPVAYDYDGDGKADVAIRRQNNRHQYILNSSNKEIQRIHFGLEKGDIPVTGDFDGDGISDVALRRPSNFHWYIKNSSDGVIQYHTFGKHYDDIPVPADYDGDGITDLAVRRPSESMWYIKNSSDGQIQRIQFGLNEEDIPVPADYDGDGKADIAVRRPSDQHWYILKSSNGVIEKFHFGRDTADIPVPSDYDGDGKADLAVRRPSTHYWYIKNSSNGYIQRVKFGREESDIPIPADYDGDGKADIAVRRPSSFFQYILNSSDQKIQRVEFGRDVDDIPIAAPVKMKMNWLGY